MYTLKENNVIKEITCGNNFEYILQNNAHFVNTDYKVLQSQTNGIFIQCMKMMRNGQTSLYYIIDDYRPMSSMFTGITPDILIAVFVNLFASILEVRNNGFLVCQSIDLSWDKIFLEPNTLKVKLVYLPLTIKAFNNYGEFESELRSNIVRLINKVINVTNGKLNQFISDLCNGSMTLEEVYNKLRNVNTSSPLQQPLNNGNLGQQSVANRIKMVGMNTPKNFEILIDKDEVLLGKKQEAVDIAIPFNNMISRKHCRIIRRNGNFYISDEKSANGTYVNGVRLLQGQQQQINKEDIVRLANTNFQIK